MPHGLDFTNVKFMRKNGFEKTLVFSNPCGHFVDFSCCNMDV